MGASSLPHAVARHAAGPAALEQVEELIQRTVSGPGLMGAAASHLVVAPTAKRARPRLVLAFGELVGVQGVRLASAAAAVELIHTASLLHDDVVDEADSRRSVPSVNARFGNSAAVLAGDLVLARALGLLAFDPRAVAAAIETVSAMSVAAVREIEVRGDVQLSLEEHRAIAEGKTGALFGLCGRLAGLVADDLHAARRMEDAACGIGLAFQLADDVGDVHGDLLERTPTYPILEAARCDPSIAAEVAKLWGSSPPHPHLAGELAARVLAGPAVSRAIDVVQRLISTARAQMEPWSGMAAHAEIFRFAATLENIAPAPSRAP